MCGRYARVRSASELQLAFDFPEPDASGADLPAGAAAVRGRPPQEQLEPDYNLAPGAQVYGVLGTPPGEAGRGAAAGPQSLAAFRWGLVPSWARDRNAGYRMINARSETAAEKPAFREALRHRRCLLPADAYYEWQYLPDAEPGAAHAGTSPATDPDHARRKAASRKRPFAVSRSDGTPLALAGLFERWRDPERADDDPAAWLWTCAVVTTEAAGALAGIHERMPVALPPEEWAAWLDPRSGYADVERAMAATPVGALTARSVSTAVNSIRSSGPGLLEPPTEEEEAALLGPPTLF
ncbi:SOS response-associated peptidase [Nocardiopsis coralliicola]